MPTPEEIVALRARLRAKQAAQGTNTAVSTTKQEFNVPPTQEPKSSGGLRGLVSRLVNPLVDVPDLPGGIVGEVVERGIEELSSPIGLASAALIPVTGGASLGLRGVAGVGARLATRGVAEAATGGAASLAAQAVNERLPENTHGALRLAATLGAGAIGGIGTAGIAGRTVDALPGGARAVVRQAARNQAKDLTRALETEEVVTLTNRARLNRIEVPDTSYKAPGLEAVGVRADPAFVAGKRWFHGTNAEGMAADNLAPLMTKEDSLFGFGIYMTDNPKIAAQYARARSSRRGNPIIYEAKVNPARVLDLEEPLKPEVYELLRGMGNIDEEVAAAIEAAAKLPDATNESVWSAMTDALSDYSIGNMVPSGEISDWIFDLTFGLREAGYDALTHTGGVRAGRNSGIKHQVLIMLDPNDTMTSPGIGRAGQVSDFSPAPESVVRGYDPQIRPLALSNPSRTVTTRTRPSLAAQVAPPVDPDVASLIDGLRKAKAMMSDRAVMSRLKEARKGERGRRLGAARGTIDPSGTSDQIERAFLGANKGKLSALEFPEIEISPETIESLYKRALEGTWNPDAPLRPYEARNAKAALARIFEAGEVPARSELKLLDKLFGPQLTEAISDLRPYGAKGYILDAINLPRAVMASADLSFGLRQGILAFGADPIEFLKGNISGAKAFASPEYAAAVDDMIRGVAGTADQQTVTNFLKQWNVDFTGSALTPEEAFQAGKLGRKLFGSNEAGRVMQGSERAFTTTGNYLRWVNGQKIATRLAKLYGKEGDDLAKQLAAVPYEEGERLARALNVMTGRSGLKILEGDKGRIANAFFFAPNFLASRFMAPTLLPRSIIRNLKANPKSALNPVAMWKSDPVMALEAKSLGGFMAQGFAGMAMFKAAEKMGWIPEFEIETDPRSSAFGKVKWGNSEYDFWAGYSPIARAIARTAYGESKSRSGNISDTDRLGVIWDEFVRSKAAPVPGAFWDAKTGTNMIGEKVSVEDGGLERQVKELLLPLFIQDMFEGMQEEGAGGLLKTSPSFLGLGVNTFVTLGQIKDSEARRLFKKPFEELTQTERSVVNESPKVLDKERERDELQPDESFSATIQKIDLGREQSQQIALSLLGSKQLTRQKFAEMMGEIQRDSALAKKQAAEIFNVEFAEKDSLLDQALNDWFQLYDLADRGAEQGIVTNQIDFDKFNQMEADLFSRFTPEQIAFVEERTRPGRDGDAKFFYDNKDYVAESGYYDVADTRFNERLSAVQRVMPDIETYGQLIAARDFYRLEDPALFRRLDRVYKQIQKRITSDRERMRKRDPKLDAALYAIGATSTFQTRRAQRILDGS